MKKVLFDFGGMLVPGSGLPDDIVKRLASKRADVDKMKPFDADVYASKIMSGVSKQLWMAMSATNIRVRQFGFSETEALIDLASNILSVAQYVDCDGAETNGLGIVGKTVYINEDGVFDKPPKKTATGNRAKKATAKKLASKKK